MGTDPKVVGEALLNLLGERTAAGAASRAAAAGESLSESTISKMLHGRALTLANVEAFLRAIDKTFHDLAEALGQSPSGVAHTRRFGPPTADEVIALHPGAPDHLQLALHRAYSAQYVAERDIEMVTRQIEAWHRNDGAVTPTSSVPAGPHPKKI